MRRAGIAYLGHSQVILKSGQEPSFVAWKGAVQRERGTSVEVAMVESPAGESVSDGVAERAAEEIQGQSRTLKDAFDARYQERKAGDSPCLLYTSPSPRD
eukprot:6990286-Alexandrium_andersonii.AAC.1